MTVVVFLGPSLPVEDARKILDADYRPPIARGDLAAVPAGGVVAIIDGVFHQQNAVSPTEIRDALARGTRVLGSSSMGALRACEVPGMEGVGRVYAMFKSGELENDDEVALTFDTERFRPLSEPLVNIRHAVERLTSSGTIEQSVGHKILSTAGRLYYPERTYPRILSEAGLRKHPQAAFLQAMLQSHDLKRDDAISLLEQLARMDLTSAREPLSVEPGGTLPTEDNVPPDELAPVLFWEFGYSIPFDELVSFMKLTGTFASHARNAVARFLLEGNQLDESFLPSALADDEVESLAIHRFLQWDCRSKEARQVTARDLGMTLDEIWAGVAEETVASNVMMALARDASPEFLRALRGELFANELALKREAVRCGSLAFFAARAGSKPPTANELSSARRVVCELVDAASWPRALELLGRWGVGGDQAEAFAARLAQARKAVRLGRERPAAIGRTRRARATLPAINLVRLQRRTKHKGDRRFSIPMSQAARHAERLRSTIQITRVSIISGLDSMGLPIAQAFRPGVGVWSNTVGGGKSTTVTGAKVGAVMEEVEKWAQEQFPQPARGPAPVHGSYAALRRRYNIVDPALLELPYDSCYRPDLPFDWCWLTDLMNERAILVPIAAVDPRRSANDICYTQRGGRKTVSTNGLASGFSLEEAVAHAVSEVIERHAHIMASLITQNPGVPWAHDYRFVDLKTVPPSTKRIVERIQRSGRRVRILDITSEIAVPTFLANVMVESEPWSERFGGTAGDNLGTAAYPDPEVAMNAALLEAAQTRAGSIAGAREDLSLKARSLGRHERTRCRTRASTRLVSGTTGAWKAFASIAGFCSRDIKLDIEWIMERLRAAGAPHLLVLDLSVPEIRPARVARVVVPGLETINPFYTGARGRAAMISDLLASERAGERA
jgi:ribosomal protein S12 methylthiotransferase accessory factor